MSDCQECDRLDRVIRDLESKLERAKERLDEANEHLVDIENQAREASAGADAVYRNIKTGF